jgi:hypothetical protein
VVATAAVLKQNTNICRGTNLQPLLFRSECFAEGKLAGSRPGSVLTRMGSDLILLSIVAAAVQRQAFFRSRSSWILMRGVSICLLSLKQTFFISVFRGGPENGHETVL